MSIANLISQKVWAIRESFLHELIERLHAATAPPAPGPIRSELEELFGAIPDQRYAVTDGGTALLMVSGIITKGLDEFERMWFGAYDLGWLEHDLEAIQEDPSAKRMMLAVRSPGGMVTGVPEASSQLAEFSKPWAVYSDSEIASAAMWLGAAADEILISPSAVAGSVGVYSALIDSSAAFAQMGLKTEVIRSGAQKGTIMPGLPLSDADRASLQADVDNLGEIFRDHIADYRPRVKPESMQGQVFRGQKAVEAGFADQLASSFSEAIKIMES